MNAKPIDGPMKWLGIAFASYLVGWGVLFAFVAMDIQEPAASVCVVAGAIGIFGGGLLYLITLGQVAARTGRSVITWVGLTMLLSPFSYLFAYPMLKSKVERPPQSAT